MKPNETQNESTFLTWVIQEQQEDSDKTESLKVVQLNKTINLQIQSEL